MNILFITNTDRLYLYPTKIMLTSLLINNPKFDYDIKILMHEELSDDNKQEILKLYSKITFEMIDAKIYTSHAARISKSRFKTSSYNAISRFEMFNYENYDKLIYLDSDIIIDASLDFLINNCNENECYAVKHEVGNYFNAGVLVFNKKTSFNEYKRRCINFLETYTGELPGNQIIFNNCFNASYIDSIYNLTVAYKEADKLIENGNIVIYHYPGAGKPWLSTKFSDYYLANGSEKTRNAFIDIWQYYNKQYMTHNKNLGD